MQTIGGGLLDEKVTDWPGVVLDTETTGVTVVTGRLSSWFRTRPAALLGLYRLSGLVMVGGEVAGFAHWPRYGAAAIAFGVALATHGSMMATVA